MYVSLTCSGAVYFFVDDSAQSNDGAICDPLKGPRRFVHSPVLTAQPHVLGCCTHEEREGETNSSLVSKLLASSGLVGLEVYMYRKGS